MLINSIKLKINKIIVNKVTSIKNPTFNKMNNNQKYIKINKKMYVLIRKHLI